MEKERIVHVSVIVPVYNGEAHIRECLESLKAQKLKEIEFIIVDDGSNDGTREILEKYQSDRRFHIIHQKNKGRMPARKNGLAHARATYIGFVDADDFIHSNMFSDMYETAMRLNADIVSCGITNVNVGGEVEQVQIFPYIFNEVRRDKILPDSPPTLWNNIFHRFLFEYEDVEFFNISRGEDLAIVPCLFYYANHTVMLDEPYYFYRNVVEDTLRLRSHPSSKNPRYPVNLYKDLQGLDDLCFVGEKLAMFYLKKSCSAEDLLSYTFKFPLLFNRYNFIYTKDYFVRENIGLQYMEKLVRFILSYPQYYLAARKNTKSEDMPALLAFERSCKIKLSREQLYIDTHLKGTEKAKELFPYLYSLISETGALQQFMDEFFARCVWYNRLSIIKRVWHRLAPFSRKNS